jgi:hypothetical protein
MLAAQPFLAGVVELDRAEPVVWKHKKSPRWNARAEAIQKPTFVKDTNAFRMDPLARESARC